MKISDRVVCIRTIGNIFGVGIVKGQIYTIYNIHICPTCNAVYFDVGLPDSPGSENCTKCHTTIGPCGVCADSRHFRPIEYNSATEELANKEIVKETSDIPIKEPV